jgi:hypothetical protein
MPRGGGAHPYFPSPLEEWGGGTGHTCVAPSRMRRCTPSAAVVPAPTQLALGQVQVGTALGVAVPPNKVVVPLGKPAVLGLCRQNLVDSLPRGMPKVVYCRQTCVQATNEMVMQNNTQVYLGSGRRVGIIPYVLLCFVIAVSNNVLQDRLP